MGINIRETIVANLEKTLEKNDYMSLVSVQMRIKTGFYEHPDVNGGEKAAADIKFLTQYKKSYPHIEKQIDEVIAYLETLLVTAKLEGAN